MAMAISEISIGAVGASGGRIGLLGGTFDPVHNGHLAAARAVKDQLDLDEVLLLPAAIPPHKSTYHISSFGHRAAMIAIAVQDEPGISVCLIEQERQGPSYTIDTLIQLNKQLPASRFYFIIGSDAFADIYSWKGYRNLTNNADLVVLNRPGSLASNSEIIAAYFPDFVARSDKTVWQAQDIVGKIHSLEIRPINISSSKLRYGIAEKNDISPYLPAGVVDYIATQGLYSVRTRKTAGQGSLV